MELRALGDPFIPGGTAAPPRTAPEVSAVLEHKGGGWGAGRGLRAGRCETSSARAWNRFSDKVKKERKVLVIPFSYSPGLCKTWFPGLVENGSGQLAPF